MQEVGGSSPSSGSISMIKVHSQSFAWKELIKSLGVPEFSKCSNVITYARKHGLGSPISFQKSEYSAEELKAMSILLRWYDFLSAFSNVDKGLFTDAMFKNLVKVSVQAIKNDAVIPVVSIFCPSYKTGAGAIGYKKEIGAHTKAFIESLKDFIFTSRKIGLQVSANIFFSDLLLENLNLLKGTSYEEDLENNFVSFSSQFRNSNWCQVRKLSDIAFLNESVGQRGFVSEKAPIEKNLYAKILKRNSIFYSKTLGWSNETIANRTKTLYHSYGVIGKYMRNLFPNGIMFWAESAYERGLMYNTMLSPEEHLPIIYPAKIKNA